MRMLVFFGSREFHEGEGRTSIPDVREMAHFVLDEKHMRPLALMLAKWVEARGGQAATLDVARTNDYNQKIFNRENRN